MGVIATNKWLKKYKENKKHKKNADFMLQKEILCEGLKENFKDATRDEIHEHLLKNGLFLPDQEDVKVIDEILSKDFWTTSSRFFKKLKKEWKGPDVPIFIFPANYQNRSLRKDFNGKTGLAYRDKIFLFISSHTSEHELKALLTHEYNHVCRLSHMNKTEEEMTLLDTLVLEGLAEKAVLDILGHEHLANWTSIYTKDQALQFWKKCILPNKELKKTEQRHMDIIYGMYKYPKWCGYNIGYHLISTINNGEKTSDLLRKDTSQLIAESEFDL